MENSRTLADSRITFGDIPGAAITMHVVVQPPVAKKKTGLFNLSICALAKAVWVWVPVSVRKPDSTKILKARIFVME